MLCNESCLIEPFITQQFPCRRAIPCIKLHSFQHELLILDTDLSRRCKMNWHAYIEKSRSSFTDETRYCYGYLVHLNNGESLNTEG